MAILRLAGVRREIGTFVILDSISAAIAHGDRTGLVGPNGAGKTTLLRIAAGLEPPDAGEVTRKNGLKMGLLTQESNLDKAFIAAESLRAAVRSGADELERMENRLAHLEAEGAQAVQSDEYAHLRESFEHRGGYTLDLRVDAALSGLGFRSRRLGSTTDPAFGRTADAGGVGQAPRGRDRPADARRADQPPRPGRDRMARAGASRTAGRVACDVARPGFSRWCCGSHLGAARSAADGIPRQLRAYALQREERDARARKDEGSLSEQIARERELVQRYRSHRKFPKMHEHEARLEALLEQQAAVPERHKSGVLALTGVARAAPPRGGEVAVRIEGLVGGYAGKPVVRVDRLEARRGARIGLVGPNGAGKTTLLRTIAGELAPIDGWLELGHGVQIGYLAQIRQAPMPGTTVLEALTNGGGMDQGPARSYLARFLFRGEDVFKPDRAAVRR